MIKCVNLDWLEVHALEPRDPRDAQFFMSQGFYVESRPYGTRIYHEMFIIHDQQGQPFIEVRRKPKSLLHSPFECHLRLVNRYCYHDDAAQLMQQFLDQYGYTFNRISRVDICLDFIRFDSGDIPLHFLRRYINETYSKINQSRVTAHGADTWGRRDWNSISWGSPTSDISTKFYDKTLELYDPQTRSWKKPYIIQQWQLAGLIPDYLQFLQTEYDTNLRVWRLEFSIRSSVKKWFVIQRDGKERDHQSIRNTLDCYFSRDRILCLFLSLTRHYFHFKHFIEGQRKDRCPDKVLFNYDDLQEVYTVGRDYLAKAPHPNRDLSRILRNLQNLINTHPDRKFREAVSFIIDTLKIELMNKISQTPLTREDLARRILVGLRTRGHQVSMAEVMRYLNLNETTAPF